MYLTEKQKRVYQFIKEYIETYDIAPSYEEIRNRFRFRSLSTVFDHVRTLERKGAITKGRSNEKRSIRLSDIGRRSVAIPLLGTVVAGRPLEMYEILDTVDVPEEMLSHGENVALRVRGDSMVESGIHNGDVVIVKRQNSAENGQIVIALVDGEVTIKRVYFHPDMIELRASNPAMESIYVKEGQDLKIYGILVGLYRRYNV
ncbi:MAG: transcriptional repressor LexA [Spirochaetota bacterium]|nr:MAG: transcriptional repressor LexA [Spirochaetota bacterium]